MSLCDVFVFLDDVQLNKRSYTRRVKVRHQAIQGIDRWLTVPLIKFHEDAKINTLEIDHSKPWIRQHIDIIQNTYRHQVGWKENEKWIRSILEACEAYPLLSEANEFLISEIAKKLKLQCSFIRSSNINVTGFADTYTYQIVKHLKGKTYIRGKGEQRYAKNPVWKKDDGLKVIDVQYDHFIENDSVGSWRNGYSVLDLLLMGDGFNFNNPEYSAQG